LDDLIYNFLLQTGFPRASIIFDADLLSTGQRNQSELKIPAFVIVDPETANPLAVIEVVDAIDGNALKQTAIGTSAYASNLADAIISSYVIRVDVAGRVEEEQVQFYRIRPDNTLQQLSSKNFPDLNALKVARKLVHNQTTTSKASLPGITNRPGAGMYLPAVALLVLVIIEGALVYSQGAGVLSTSQSVLAFGAAILLTLPAAIRYMRR